MKNRHELKYGDYIIHQLGWSNLWSWQHSSYDGPGDERHGEAKTIEECLQQIDDLVAEEAADELERAHSVVERYFALGGAR